MIFKPSYATMMTSWMSEIELQLIINGDNKASIEPATRFTKASSSHEQKSVSNKPSSDITCVQGDLKGLNYSMHEGGQKQM